MLAGKTRGGASRVCQRLPGNSLEVVLALHSERIVVQAVVCHCNLPHAHAGATEAAPPAHIHRAFHHCGIHNPCLIHLAVKERPCAPSMVAQCETLLLLFQ